jgi:hypothetical protein
VTAHAQFIVLANAHQDNHDTGAASNEHEVGTCLILHHQNGIACCFLNCRAKLHATC